MIVVPPARSLVRLSRHRAGGPGAHPGVRALAIRAPLRGATPPGFSDEDPTLTLGWNRRDHVPQRTAIH